MCKLETWLVTGVAGFIGSNILETLLKEGNKVHGIDNFATGYAVNLEQVRKVVGEDVWSNFTFFEGSVEDLGLCKEATKGVDYISHQAALGSVPRSIDDPVNSHNANVTGFVNMLEAYRLSSAKGFVYASSSAVYGDEPTLPKVESRIGSPLSPYATTKLFNELYVETFERVYGLSAVGLRYFNVFGPRQDPNGAYAAVIPKWIDALKQQKRAVINGDGTTSRDFCFVANVVQANLKAARSELKGATVLNIAVSGQTTLTELEKMIREGVEKRFSVSLEGPEYVDFRKGDIKHSLANIDQAAKLIGYSPTHTIEQGMEETLNWYAKSR